MWTDINTKPKQGTVFSMFQGHVMGILADYKDASFATRCNFRPPDWISEPVSMLPIPNDWIATQECVRVSTKPAAARPVGKVRFAVDVDEARAPTVRSTSIDYPQIEGKFTATIGGLTNLFYGCKD
jgi:hypothetical protein